MYFRRVYGKAALPWKQVYGRETRLKYRVANLNALLKFEMDYVVLFMLILGSGKSLLQKNGEDIVCNNFEVWCCNLHEKLYFNENRLK